MKDLAAPFRRHKKQLYFAVVVSDRPTDGFTFTNDKDCKFFMVTGDVYEGVVIPAEVLKELVERFCKPDGFVAVIEKPA